MTPTGDMPSLPKSPLRQKMAVALAVASALVLPLWLYTQPDLVIMLAEQLWACF
jgi:hypothetical protein